MSLHRNIVRIALVLAATLAVATGCSSGGPPTIKEASACLEKLGLEVNPPLEEDPFVEDGVFATSKLGDADVPFAFAMAAIVPKADAREDFVRDSKAYLERTEGEGKLDFASGTDGQYVWVAGGEKDAETLDDVRRCVEP